MPMCQVAIGIGDGTQIILPARRGDRHFDAADGMVGDRP